MARQSEWIEANSSETGVSSASVRRRVIRAQYAQLDRQAKLNHFLSTHEIKQHARLSTECQNFMNDAFERSCLSARVYYRIVKLARTIADVETHENIALNHLQEVCQFALP